MNCVYEVLVAAVAFAVPCVVGIGCICYRKGFDEGKRRTIERICADRKLDASRIVDANEVAQCARNLIGWSMRLKKATDNLRIGGGKVTIDKSLFEAICKEQEKKGGC